MSAIGRLIDPTSGVCETSDDWRCEFIHNGERKGCWVQGSAMRDKVLPSAMRHFTIFDRATVSSVIIRRRKDIAWTFDPKKLRTRAW